MKILFLAILLLCSSAFGQTVIVDSYKYARHAPTPTPTPVTAPQLVSITTNEAGTEAIFVWNVAVTATPDWDTVLNLAGGLTGSESYDLTYLSGDSTTTIIANIGHGPVLSTDVLTWSCDGGVVFDLLGTPVASISEFPVTNTVK